MRACPHGVVLPRGLICDRGFLVLTVEFKGKGVPHPGCGPHNKEAEVLATERLMKIRSEILRGKFGFEPEIPEKLFKDVIPLYLKAWAIEKHPDGTQAHKDKEVRDRTNVFMNKWVPVLGKLPYHTIKTSQIENYREDRLETGVKGTTVNREIAPLSHMFNHVKDLIAREKLEAFRQPDVNPCESATKAPLYVHKRLLSDYEVKKLKMACRSLKDLDALKVVRLILRTALSIADVEGLEAGQIIDIERIKTGVPVFIPITVLTKLNFSNWRKRWLAIREAAGLSVDKRNPDYVDAKVLRKTALNWAVGKFEVKILSQFAGHSSVKTTESMYTIKQEEKMKPISDFLNKRVEELLGKDEDDEEQP